MASTSAASAHAVDCNFIGSSNPIHFHLTLPRLQLPIPPAAATTCALIGTALLGAGLVAARAWSNRRRTRYLDVRSDPRSPVASPVLPGTDVAIEQIPAMVAHARDTFDSGMSFPLESRRAALDGLLRFLREHEVDIVQAIAQDLGRPKFETMVYDIMIPKREILHLQDSLCRLARRRPVSDSLLTFPSRSWIQAEPYGVALVIGTWNFPVQLCLVPIAGALAAGNVAVLAPNTRAPHTARLLGSMLPHYVNPQLLRVVGHTHARTRPVLTALLQQRWDTIFYTGSPSTGRVVYEAGAKHLTPMTLELGGKNPTFIAECADVRLAARRVVMGRMMNAGQQCIAPDYVLVHERVADQFIAAASECIQQFYEGRPHEPGRLGRMVNHGRWQAMHELLTTHADGVVFGGDHDEEDLYIGPTIMELRGDEPCTRVETFGPILQVIRVPDMEAAIRFARQRPKPLATYVFASSKDTIDLIVENVSTGGITVNATLFHVGHPGLPFGGVGDSGFGAYHGDHTFHAFSHDKPVCKKARPVADAGLVTEPWCFYPPWTHTKERVARALLEM